jgi:predicted hotdog family 3-hydroxylacyl-ACP dehydratase
MTDAKLLDRLWIEAHIPHRGRMCLLDEVVEWDAARIRCRSATHRAADNPLRSYGRLGAACGVEYAAQAMAVHGALVAGLPGVSGAQGPASKGYLASVRNVVLNVTRLDDVETDLLTDAARMTGDERSVIYEFSISGAGRTLLSGRVSVVFLMSPRADA